MEIAKLLLNHLGDLALLNPTLFKRAIYREDSEMLIFLLDAGFDIETKLYPSLDETAGSTPLLYAVEGQYIEIT